AGPPPPPIYPLSLHDALPISAEAIEAALAAGEFERAAQLVEQLSPLLLAGSQYYTLRRWIEHLPQQLWVTRPMVCLAYAWTLFRSEEHTSELQSRFDLVCRLL